MDIVLHVFNPEHDLALANNSMHFDVPQSAIQFASDLSLLPLWYGEPNSVVWSKCGTFEPPISLDTQVLSDVSSLKVSSVFPWGWDRAVYKRLASLGVEQSLLPDDLYLQYIRECSHRQYAAKASAYLRAAIGDILPPPAVLLSSIDAVHDFVSNVHERVFKAPWSGSGKGLYWNSGTLSPSLEGWCRRIIAKQGSVMGEIAYRKTTDFAMEFYCDGTGKVTFAGYSLFDTDSGGRYRGNKLLSNNDIIQELICYVSLDLLYRVEETLITFFSDTLTDNYKGYLGVDMFLFQEPSSGLFRLNPVVEINMRMTMGMVARLFYDNYVLSGKRGYLSIDHVSTDDELVTSEAFLKKQYPLRLTHNRIEKGYLSLCPVLPTTRYRIQVMIE